MNNELDFSKEENTNKANINQIVSDLSSSYIKLINDKIDLSLFPSVMLWGQPGIGKSQSIKQIAKLIEEGTNKKVNIIDVRLLLFNPIDLRGIPVANEDKSLAIWLKPKIFQMDESDSIVNILFLDEISAAPTSVQSAAYQITLDRKIGEHILPKNVIIVAAGNRLSDKAVAYKMPKPLANRLLHFNVSLSFSSWRNWAIQNNISPLIISFLSCHNELLNTYDVANDSNIFATPRGWEMVSNILNNIDSDVDKVYNLIRGLVGPAIASQLRNFYKTQYKLPSIEDIFDGKCIEILKEPSLLYEVITRMIYYTKKHSDQKDRIANSIKYAMSFPKEFTIFLIEEYLSIKNNNANIQNILFSVPEFVNFIQEKSVILNGLNNGIFKKTN